MGGKAHHIKHLDKLMPFMFDTFVDVFGGAGWVSVKSQSITKARTRIYNDYNPYLANIFSWFKQDPVAVSLLLESYPQQDADLYKQFQQEIFGDRIPATSVEAAAKYLYLEVQSFTGNTLGLNSSIYFDKKNIHGLNPLLKKLRNSQIVNRLRSIAHVENQEACDVIKKYDSESTCFYVDPPYYEKEHYYTHVYGREQHYQLAQTLKQIQGQFILSYYEFPDLLEWFPADKYRRYHYTIIKQSSSRTNKQQGRELVIRNF